MKIAIVNNGQITSIGEFREVFPNTSFPPSGPSAEFLAENNAMRVNVFRSHNLETEKLVPCTPYVEDNWVYTVEVQPKTAEELASATASKAAQKRADRDRALQASDWRAIRAAETGVPMSAEWVSYRQALRDFPSQDGFPNIDLPRDPNYVPMV